MNKMNTVVVGGVVKAIDLNTRDIVVETETARLHKIVKAVVHMWKTANDNPNCSAFEGRDEWKNKIAVGDEIVFHGHLGNNGRVICDGFVKHNDIGDEEE